MKANFGLRSLYTSVGGAKGSITGPKRVSWKQHSGGQPSVIVPLHMGLLLFSKDANLPWQYHFKHQFFPPNINILAQHRILFSSWEVFFFPFSNPYQNKQTTMTITFLRIVH